MARGQSCCAAHSRFRRRSRVSWSPSPRPRRAGSPSRSLRWRRGVPPITVCMRTFFKQRLQEEALLSTAYSLESVCIELIFLLGPMLVAVFVGLASPAAAVLFAAACGCAGTLLFQRSQALKTWRIEPRGAPSLFGPLAEPGFAPLLAVIVCYAIAFGLIEIGTTAMRPRAAAPRSPASAWPHELGSVTGGLVYGRRSGACRSSVSSRACWHSWGWASRRSRCSRRSGASHAGCIVAGIAMRLRSSCNRCGGEEFAARQCDRGVHLVLDRTACRGWPWLDARGACSSTQNRGGIHRAAALSLAGGWLALLLIKAKD